jgi:beta-galactosidase
MSLILGSQYYRPPFPRSNYWDDDLKAMKDAGLNTVQLWLVWAWIESVPGEFRYDDYDELVELAGRHGLNVVLSTIAAVHPYWIHREVPGSEMVTNMGHRVISTNRREIHFGITPGGCIDHPGVKEHMRSFLETTADHYHDATNLVGWDVWNELRWNVHADGLVCYCEHTVAAFRDWLKERYGDLDGLNRAWERRYGAWDEVFPGKRPERVYTEMMAFQEFITERSVHHARWRYEIVKSVTPGLPVTVHGGKPTVLHGSDGYESEQPSTALHRGNDWGFADVIDGVGTSSFPVWEKIDHADFLSRVDFVGSAARARGRALWLSEVQGGRSGDGFAPQHAVSAGAQQRWLWSGVAAGASAVLFWCWRDEIFGRESGGFGIVGADGHAAERVAALGRAREVIDRESTFLDDYVPEQPRVGVWFSPRTYYLCWCQDGDANRAMRAVQGVSRVLVRHSIPYTIVEADHTDVLSGLSIVFMPRGLVVDAPQAEALGAWVRDGGTLVVESEAGAFGGNGIYRYPAERFLHEMGGIVEAGRRMLPGDAIPVELDLNGGGATYFLPATQWATPYTNGALTAQASVGKGRVIAVGLYSAEAYYAGQRAGDTRYQAAAGEYERFVVDLVRSAGCAPAVTVAESAPDQPLACVRVGTAGNRPLVFVFNEEPGRALTVRFSGEIARSVGDTLRDLISDTSVHVSDDHTAAGRRTFVTIPPTEWGVTVLTPTQ